VSKQTGDRPLRVCLLTYRGNPRSGGQGVYVKLLAAELVAMGHAVDVWSGPPYPELDEGVRLVKVPSLDLWNDDALLRFPDAAEFRDPVNVAEWARTMLGEFPEPRTFCRRVARSFRDPRVAAAYDVVHDNQSLGPGLLEMATSLPVLATIHHPVTVDFRIALENADTMVKRIGLRRWYSFLGMQKKVARRLDRVLTVSEASRTDLAREYGIDDARMRVVGNGINVDVFQPDASVTRRKDQLVTTLSADTPLKGFGYLLEAVAALRSDRPDLRLVVIGSLAEKSPNQKKLDDLGLADIVTFTGRVEATRIAEEYAGATAAVVPSLYEGFGFPAGEAMACEVPVVSTNAGALPEVVGEDGHAGRLVEPGSTASLVAGLRDVLDADPERLRTLGVNGRRRVLDNFTWRHAASRTVDSYRDAMEAEKRPC
jgi:glycosyltransferase involved in cell wall biosynthesis